MEKKIFQEGMSKLIDCYPGLSFEPKTLKVWFELLSHHTDRKFSRAIDIVCRGEVSIYSNTNIVALIGKAVESDWRAG